MHPILLACAHLNYPRFLSHIFKFIFVKSSLATKLNNRLAGESSVSDNLCKKLKRLGLIQKPTVDNQIAIDTEQ